MTTYLNASSRGLPSKQTEQRICDYVGLELQIGAVAASDTVEPELSEIRNQAASLIGGATGQTGFSSTTSSAWLSIVARLNIAGKRLLVAPHEWGANVATLKTLAGNAGAQIEVLPRLDLSAPDVSEWQARIDEDVAAIFVPMVTSISGHRYPVEAIGALPRPDHCNLIIDAAQAIGQVEIDVSNLSCDALVATCRKWLRGPKETALFWMSPSAPDELNAGSIEQFDTNIALRLGLGTAIAEIRQISFKSIEEQIGGLSAYAYQCARSHGLDTLTKIAPQTGAVCLAIPAEQAQAIHASLENANCLVKWPVSETDEPNASEQPDNMVAMRIAPHVYNSTSDIDTLFAALSEGLKTRS